MYDQSHLLEFKVLAVEDFNIRQSIQPSFIQLSLKLPSQFCKLQTCVS